MQLNQQAPEKRVHQSHLSVYSVFDTIQGEGPFCGTPAVFIRLAGCNLQCPACDTDYTSGRTDCTVEHVVNLVKLASNRVPGLVVITGGEPFRQDIGALIGALCAEAYYVQIETNGTLPPPINAMQYIHTNTSSRRGAFVVCSPKTGAVHPATIDAACCYKYVMSADSVDPRDGLPVLALDHSAAPRVARPPVAFRRPVYLQPMDEQNVEDNARHLRACMDSCMEHGYILQIQLHKLLGVL